MLLECRDGRIEVSQQFCYQAAVLQIEWLLTEGRKEQDRRKEQEGV
jgi:hypothetical protein